MTPKLLLFLEIFLVFGHTFAVSRLTSFAVPRLTSSDRSKREVTEEDGADEVKSEVGTYRAAQGQSHPTVNLVDFFKEKRKQPNLFIKGKRPTETDEESLQGDQFLRLMGKLLSLSNAPPSHSAYRTGGLVEGGPWVAEQRQRDPSSSVSQLLSALYEHPGKMPTSEDEHPPISLYSNKLFDPFGIFQGREGKRSGANNPGYICHFKLCQFGSSGKRLYKPNSSH